MKSAKDVRVKGDRDAGEFMKKAMKLEPNKKSGKERHAIYGELDDDDLSLYDYKKRESVLDYFDDEAED